MKALVRTPVLLLSMARQGGRGRLAGSILLLLLGYLATPGIALVLRRLTDAALAGHAGTAGTLALGAVALLLAELMFGHFAHLLYFELGELAEATLQEELLTLANGTHGLENHDSPEFADTLVLVREDLPKTRSALEALLQLGGLTVQTLITTVILGTLNPWMALLPLAAVPPVVLGRRAQDLVERAKERAAPQIRLSRHLLTLATSAASVKELRLCGTETELLERHRAGWDATTATLQRAHLRAAVLRAAGQTVFAAAYGGVILLILWQAVHGRAGLGDVVLVITLAVQVSVQVASALGLLTVLQGAGRIAERMADLRRWSAGMLRPGGERPAPAVLREGIRFENVGFGYPGSGTKVLDGVDLFLPAGRTVALVGENGAGKSTMVKLLCGLYQPTEGRILVDGVDLRDLSAEQWSRRIAPLFQDFARLELLLRENVGVGAVASIEDDAVLTAALARAGAERIVARVPGGLDGLLGRGYGDGAELSGGQWQTLGLARCLVRPEPLLMLLDEPAAALDAAAESNVFERFGDSAGRAARERGAVTLFVSHRFSTVRMADLIVVLENGRVLESGSHAELMANDLTYRELFDLQARAYR
ncbi:ABC transporter ATP-binding protein [Kitasatospora sp. LaBMicrA B282]|uniref:ABC transporter ATP-binding protein n=1 Tax=Kitasatospora sp. LaBMicrA B282 TaxID=3420949 RepID=UPI003D0A250E